MTPTDQQLIARTLDRAEFPAASNLRRIGIDRGFNSRIHRFDCGTEDLVAKVGTDPSRFPHNTREIDVLEHFGPRCALPAPHHRAHLIDEEHGHVILIMNHVQAHEPDTEKGIDLRTLDLAIGSMEGCWNTRPSQAPSLPRPLPNWGIGTQGTPTPHRRRVERFRRRSRNHLEHFTTDTDSARRSIELVKWLDANLEACLTESARWPRTLIHGDLHPENMLISDDGVIVLDWQTTSWGPPIMDLMRLVLDGIPSIPLPELEERILSLSRIARELACDDQQALRRSAIAAAITHAGFISGWGGRPLSTLTNREKAIVQHHASPMGPGRLVHELLSTHW